MAGDLPYLRHVVEAQYILVSALRERVAARGLNPISRLTMPTLKQAIADDTVVIIDCSVDCSENTKLTEKLGNLVCPT